MSGSKRLKISIVTVCFNSEKTIEDTILSVINQKKENYELEYVLIDGSSTDNTMAIINGYKEHIQKIISEKDTGLYDAMNKGIDNSSGNIIGFLHSDDQYTNPNVLDEIAKAFMTEKTSIVYGNLIMVDKENINKVVRTWKSSSFCRRKLFLGWMPPHPTVFIHRECYDQYGKFDLNFRTSGDYELLIRLLLKYEYKPFYIDEYLVRMRLGGQSNASLKNRIKSYTEDIAVWTKYGFMFGPLYVSLKICSKIIQFIQKP